MRTFLVLFFLVSFCYLVADKISIYIMERKKDDLTIEYLRKDTQYRDSLNRVIHNMGIEIEGLKKELNKKRRR